MADLLLDRELWEAQLEKEINLVLQSVNCALITTLHTVSFIRKAESIVSSIRLTIGPYHYELSAIAWGWSRENYPTILVASLIGSLIASKMYGLSRGQLSLCWSGGEKRIRVYSR